MHGPVIWVASLHPCLHCLSVASFLLEIGVNLGNGFSVAPVPEISPMKMLFGLKKNKKKDVPKDWMDALYSDMAGSPIRCSN